MEPAEGGRPGARNAGVGILIGTVLAGVPATRMSGLRGAWGRTELIVGAVVFAAGVCVLLGMMWARIVGVILATLSAIGNFLVLPYYPVWSVILIAVDVFIIWSLVSREWRSPG